MTAVTTTLPNTRPGIWARFGRNNLAVIGGVYTLSTRSTSRVPSSRSAL